MSSASRDTAGLPSRSTAFTCSAGRSATAAAAYRSASLILCDREGRVHDYSRKAGVEHAVILVPEDAPAWAQDRAALWNAAEARETRSNSVTAREWELALPAELALDRGGDLGIGLGKGRREEGIGRGSGLGG